MKGALNDKTIYNTYADIIDWNSLTEKECQTIRDLKDNNIEITLLLLSKTSQVFPIGQKGYIEGSSVFTGKKHMLSDYLDKMPHGIVDKRIPGIGATTLEINSKKKLYYSISY